LIALQNIGFNEQSGVKKKGTTPNEKELKRWMMRLTESRDNELRKLGS
jgi:hypothetical protein